MKTPLWFALVAALALGPVTLIALAVLWPASTEPAPEYTPQPWDDKLADLASHYVDAGCWQCHSVWALETELARNFGPHAAGGRPVGPDLSGIGNKYHRDWHVAHFADPQAITPGSQMPAQHQLFADLETGKLTPRGEKVIEFLLTLKHDSPLRKPWPTESAAAPAGDRKAGAEVYSQHCAGCHGAGGQGNGPAAKYFIFTRPPVKLAQGEWYRVAADAPLHDSLYATITQGIPGTGMPSFADTLTDQQRADVAAYVRHLAGK